MRGEVIDWVALCLILWRQLDSSKPTEDCGKVEKRIILLIKIWTGDVMLKRRYRCHRRVSVS